LPPGGEQAARESSGPIAARYWKAVQVVEADDLSNS
jgi:hypothetical protein